MKRMTERRQSPRYFTAFRNLIALTAAVILFSAVNTEATEVNCDVSGDIPFTITNSFTNKRWCFQCLGPWARDSGSIQLDTEHQDCKFYAAARTIFSPYGRWKCAVIQWDATPFDCSLGDIDSVTTLIYSKRVCLNSFSGGAHFDITSDGKFTTNLTNPPCDSSATSYLGNNPIKQKRDTDEFVFSGSEGDEAFIRIEADPAAGSNGGQLILSLDGDSLHETASGTMPLEITAVLPESGEYVVTVDQPKRSDIEGREFRGVYNLTVDLPPNGIEVITPAESTEE